MELYSDSAYLAQIRFRISLQMASYVTQCLHETLGVTNLLGVRY